MIIPMQPSKPRQLLTTPVSISPSVPVSYLKLLLTSTLLIFLTSQYLTLKTFPAKAINLNSTNQSSSLSSFPLSHNLITITTTTTSSSLNRTAVNVDKRRRRHPQQAFALTTVQIHSRFDNPWHIPKPVQFPSLQQSRYRLLYSPVRLQVGSGLGHAMAIVNTEVATAFRLGLTYTHRVSRYGHLSDNVAKILAQPNASAREQPQSQFQSAGAIERLFGWGAGEIPREQLYPALCGPGFVAMENRCAVCNGSWINSTVTRERVKLPKYAKHNFRVDHVVEIPDDLSYKPHGGRLGLAKKVDAFLKQHPHPYTVFTMPAARCDKYPAYSSFDPVTRSFYFHKYWMAHGGKGQTVIDSTDEQKKETFIDFYRRIASNRVIPNLGKRPPLVLLNTSQLNIAVHARRGDFFDAKRPMISVHVIGVLVRFLVSQVIRAERVSSTFECIQSNEGHDCGSRAGNVGDAPIMNRQVFARMPICISIYSEGRSKWRNARAHDVTQQTHEFVDVDGHVMTTKDVTRIVNGPAGKDGVEVKLRISANTVLSIHEMVAADVFIGSSSGMSTHVIGSLSRAAFLLQVSRGADPNNRFIDFNSSTGEIKPDQVAKMKELWRIFVHNHAAT